jgi:DNA polymerase-3 subunit delta
MIIFLYGPDDYRLRQSIREVVYGYSQKHKSGTSLFSADLTDRGGFDVFDGAAKSGSFFNEVRLIVLKNSFKNKEISGKLLERINKFELAEKKDVVILIGECRNGKDMKTTNADLFNKLSGKSSLVKEILPLSGTKLVEWISKEALKRKVSMDKKMALKMADICGEDTWLLSLELDKLAAFKHGSDSKISESDISDMIKSSTELNIFDLIDAVLARNRQKAFTMLFTEIENGREPHYILSMFVFGFRNFLMIKDLLERGLSRDEIAKKAAIHPFIVKKSIPLLKAFSLDKLKSIYSDLLRIDTDSKKGIINITDSLYTFVMGI